MRLRKETDELAGDEILFLAEISDAFAHPVRLKLFRAIMQSNRQMKALCNKDLVATFPYAQATISQHMAKLIGAGLIETKKQDKFTYYYAHIGMLMKYVDLSKKFAM